MKTEREVLDSFLQPNLAIQSKEVFVAPARNAKRRVDGLSGQIAAIKTLASAINHGPRLKYSLTCQNPFDAIAPRTIEQHGENRITRRCGRLTRLWQTLSHFGQNSINDKVVARKRLGAAHTGPRAAHAAHAKLPLFNREPAAVATLERETLPLCLVQLLTVEIIAPLVNGRGG